MSPDDERLRALLHGTPTPEAHRALGDLRPSMRRARSRRHVTLGAATAVLIAGGGAGVLAVSASLPQPARQTSTTRLSPVTEVTDVPGPSTTEFVGPPNEPATTESVDTPMTGDAVAGPAPDPATTTPPHLGDAAPTPPPITTDPVVPPNTSVPAAPAPPPVVAPTVEYLEPVRSDCGELVVGVQGSRIRIARIEPADGFEPSVSDDGPRSIEVTLRSGDVKCELHVEADDGGLHIDVQNGS